MSQQAKDLYEAFHDAMGNWNRIPFEYLSTRESAAWQVATGWTSKLEEQLEEFHHDLVMMEGEVDQAEAEAEELEEELTKANRTITELESQIESLKSQISRLRFPF